VGQNIPKQQVELNLFEEKIINVLSSEAVQIDKISSLTGLSTSDCLVHLLSLEFKGLVKQLPGKMFALI
jgi:DNA processing protein